MDLQDVSSTSPGYVDRAKQVGNYATSAVSDLYKNASQPGSCQKTTYAFMRSVAGVASIHLSPYSAGLGALAGSVTPGPVKKGCEIADKMISAFWNTLPHEAKIGLPVAGAAAVAYGLDPTSLFNAMGSIFALKLGAELAVRNYSKENVAEAVRKAESAEGIEN